MAVTDAFTYIPRWRVEIWVVLLFVQMVASVVLLDDVRTRLQKLRAVSWLAGCYLGLYNGMWGIAEVVKGHFYSNVGLYPFGLNVSILWFLALVVVGLLFMALGANNRR